MSCSNRMWVGGKGRNEKWESQDPVSGQNSSQENVLLYKDLPRAQQSHLHIEDLEADPSYSLLCPSLAWQAGQKGRHFWLVWLFNANSFCICDRGMVRINIENIPKLIGFEKPSKSVWNGDLRLRERFRHHSLHTGLLTVLRNTVHYPDVQLPLHVVKAFQHPDGRLTEPVTLSVPACKSWAPQLCH